MSDSTTTDLIVRQYFQRPDGQLFWWTNEAREVRWLDGTTVAFRLEVATALNRLSSGSLPGVTELLLALAAMRKSWPDIAPRLERVIRVIQESAFTRQFMRNHGELFQSSTHTFAKLTWLSEYTNKQDRNTLERANILALLFEQHDSPFSFAQQSEIAAAFESGAADEWLIQSSSEEKWHTYALPTNDEEEDRWRQQESRVIAVQAAMLALVRAAELLAAGIPDDAEETWPRRMRTGLSDDVRPLEETPLDQRSQVRSLLKQLRTDEKLCGLASLTQQLVAAISLPRPLDARETLQAGGFSDISNRGHLDKLLLSELSHEDMTLAMRIALNEAMYIRHETPPRPQPHCRMVLIDNSLPLWGIPRLYATAMALALHLSADRATTIRCFQSTAEDITAADLATRAGIDDCMGTIAPTEHCGHAISPFERAVLSADDPAEPVIISTNDVLQNADFQQKLAGSSLRNLWLICVARDGQLRVIHRTCQGSSLFKQIHLPLTEILSPRDVEHVHKADVRVVRPAILAVSNFPLLLSHHVRNERAWRFLTSVVAVADDGRLMLWGGRGLGGRQIAEGLPERSVILLSRSPQHFHFVASRANAAELVALSPGPSPLLRRSFLHSLHTVSHAVRIADHILLFGTRQSPQDEAATGGAWCAAVHFPTGRELGVTRIAGDSRRIRGRCVFIENRWSMIVWSGSVVQWVYQEIPKEFQECTDILEARPGQYIGVTRDGKLKLADDCTDDDLVRLRTVSRTFPRLTAIHQTQPDGPIQLTVDDGNQTPQMIDYCLEESELVRHTPGTAGHEESQIARVVQQRSPHYRFRGIAIGNLDQIILWGASGGKVQIQCHRLRREIVMQPFAASIHGLAFREFLDHSDGFLIGKAKWDSGACAWLDSRGLLHLKPAQAGIPETTLTLRDGRVSGWISPGQVFGDDYSCGRGALAPVEARIPDCAAWDVAIKPFLRSA